MPTLPREIRVLLQIVCLLVFQFAIANLYNTAKPYNIAEALCQNEILWPETEKDEMVTRWDLVVGRFGGDILVNARDG